MIEYLWVKYEAVRKTKGAHTIHIYYFEMLHIFNLLSGFSVLTLHELGLRDSGGRLVFFWPFQLLPTRKYQP